jgi:hypothetical protein
MESPRGGRSFEALLLGDYEDEEEAPPPQFRQLAHSRESYVEQLQHNYEELLKKHAVCVRGGEQGERARVWERGDTRGGERCACSSLRCLCAQRRGHHRPPPDPRSRGAQRRSWRAAGWSREHRGGAPRCCHAQGHLRARRDAGWDADAHTLAHMHTHAHTHVYTHPHTCTHAHTRTSQKSSGPCGRRCSGCGRSCTTQSSMPSRRR